VHGSVARLDPALLLHAYATGVFPMAESRHSDDLFWVEPRERAILPLDGFHLSRSLARRLRSGSFRLTFNRDFSGVLAGCADRPETWINRPIERAMLDLHAAGLAHSVETWAGDALVGGVYGVALGRAFFAESMFSRRTDASKAALAWLVARLKVGRFDLLDCQFMTDHLASLGAVSVSRKAYVSLLSVATGAGAAAGAGPACPGADGAGLAEGRDGRDEPEFGALDRLLVESGLAADSAASGKFITQLLGQTS
jgi:leucyl/phenylalanyl-tRNA---protein transferase